MYRTTTFRLEEDALQALELIARVEGRSLSDLLREAANKYLREGPDPEQLMNRMKSDMELIAKLSERRTGAEPTPLS
ncbi:MAG: ribbon-helix-helix domain-containing protein [Actinomycetota bacterium]|nr:ribbon-helix-helix domain-containing protein [Actinomycetota bacterium]